MKTILLATSLLLTGCMQQTQLPQTSVDDILTDYETRMKAGDTTTDTEAYFASFYSAVLRNMPETKAYVGKTCTLRISMNRAAQLTAVQSEKGDPTACRDVIRAVNDATFPQFPNEKVYQQVRNAAMEFAF